MQSNLSYSDVIHTPENYTSFKATGLSPTAGMWKRLTHGSPHPERQRLGRELLALQVSRGYMLKRGTGAPAAVDGEFFTRRIPLCGSVELHVNGELKADAVWLEEGEGLVDMVNGQLLYLARARRRHYLAGYYTLRCLDLIVSAFHAVGVEPAEIQVFSFFDSPTKDRLQFRDFQKACSAAGIIKDVMPMCRLYETGSFATGADSQPNLGIVART